MKSIYDALCAEIYKLSVILAIEELDAKFDEPALKKRIQFLKEERQKIELEIEAGTNEYLTKDL